MKIRYAIGVLSLAAALLFTGCDVNEMTTLKDLSRPYAAEYKCRKLQLGGQDLLSGFEWIKLTLRPDEMFSLRYREADGGEGGYEGEYELDEEQERITLRAQNGAKHVFPYRNGAIALELLFNGRLLYAEFAAA